MSLKNKDLGMILESFVRVIRQHRQEAIPVIAIVLTNEGKLVQFSARAGQTLPEAIRYLETGVSTMVREGKCKALGLPLHTAFTVGAGVSGAIESLFLERRDGTAFQIEVADLIGGSVERLSPSVVEPRFFPRSRFAQVR